MAISKDKRRQSSNEKYVDALQDRYSKLCVVRVDFGYKKDENNEVNDLWFMLLNYKVEV